MSHVHVPQHEGLSSAVAYNFTDVELATAKELIERAKAEGFLVVPTILAEDSMQSSSGSIKPKRGRPKKPKASDYKANW